MQMYQTDLFRHTSGYATQFGPAREQSYYRSDSSENLRGLYNRPAQPAAAPVPYAVWAPASVPAQAQAQAPAPTRVPAPVEALPPIWPGPGAPQRLEVVVDPAAYAQGDPRYADVARYRVADGRGGYQVMWLKSPQVLPAEVEGSGSQRGRFARALRSLVCGSRRTP